MNLVGKEEAPVNREGRLKEERRAAQEGNSVAESSFTEGGIPTEEHSLLKDDTSAKELPSKKKETPLRFGRYPSSSP